MMLLRRATLFFVSFVILCVPLGARSDGGFSDDPDWIEAVAKSVLMLDVYDEDAQYLGSGSGFVAFNDQTLITNCHVIEDADRIVAYSDDGERYILDRVYVADEQKDVAIIGFSEPTGLTPLPINATDALKRAQTVVAIGSPIGITNTVSIGNISALYESEGVSDIQFTAPISPGSSGGALFDDDGQVIGITSATYLDAQNINIAVHASEVVKLYARWDGTSYRHLSDAHPEETPAASYAAPDGSTKVSVVADQLVWCEAGENIGSEETGVTTFGELSLREIFYSNSARNYYLLLKYSVDQEEIAPSIDLEFKLYSDGELEKTVYFSKPFWNNRKRGDWSFYNITSLIYGITMTGTYTFSCLMDGVEVYSRSIEVSLEDSSTQPATIEPTIVPVTPSPAPEGENDRNIFALDDELVWCEAGKNVANGSATARTFQNLSQSEVWAARDYYIFATLGMDAGEMMGSVETFDFTLSYDGAPMGSISITKSFGKDATTGVQRYFDITPFMNFVREPGEYAITYRIGEDELGMCAFEVYADGSTVPSATPKPTVRVTATPVPTPVPTPTPRTYGELKYGDRGEEVKALQQALIDLGYLNDTVDGIFGRKTRKAVVQFNLANGFGVRENGQYVNDPEIASNQMQQLLFDDHPVKYTKPVNALYFKDGAYAEWYNLSDDKLQIHFEVTNKSKGKAVEAFELSVYAKDDTNGLLYGAQRTYDWTTVVSFEPGETVFSDYITVPDRSKIDLISVGVRTIYYKDGTVDYLHDDDIDYSRWKIND